MKIALALLLLFASSTFAQPAPEKQEKQVDPYVREHNEKRARNPEGLLFTVRIKEATKQFHVGEVLTLELSFASTKPNTLTLDAATYDRSGRLHSDGYALDHQEGVVDPLADYFNSHLSSFMMGGIRSIPDLTDKPHVITVELNEWQRIDKPGHYRLYVVSSRVGKKGGQGVFVFNDAPPVISNIIEFDILPFDKKWSKQKLNEIISALSKPGGNHEPACAALRFLGTPEAVTEMRKRFRGDDNQCEWHYKFGLIGSRHRELVIRDMENAINSPAQAVTSHYISTLALLEFTRRAGAAPPYPSNGTEEQFNQRQAVMDQRSSAYEELRSQYLRRLVLAIPQKQGQARAISLQALLDFHLELTTDASQWSTLLSSLPDVFTQLTLEEQLRLLKYQWRPIAGPAMIPVLREVLNYSYKKTRGTQEDLFGFNQFEQEDLRSTALRRLHELSPEEGRRLILEEIRRPASRVDRQVLRSLPDETLPELNAVLLSNLQEARRTNNWFTDVVSALIERYATDEILSPVQAIYEDPASDKWDCDGEAALVAYFLRVAPAVGAEHLKRVLSARNKGYPRCYTDVLKKVADLHMSGEVEDIAVAALDDANAEVVSQAASVLGSYGSGAAEKALWQRLEKLHYEMEGRSDEPSLDQEKIETALRKALAGAKAWLSDPEKLKRMRDLCFTEKGRAEIDWEISSWEPGIYVDATRFDETVSMATASYVTESLASLKEKLLQFPKGTVLKWRYRGHESQEPKNLPGD